MGSGGCALLTGPPRPRGVMIPLAPGGLTVGPLSLARLVSAPPSAVCLLCQGRTMTNAMRGYLPRARDCLVEEVLLMPTGIFTRKGSARSARVKHMRTLWTAGRRPAHPLDFSGPSCPSALLHKSFIKCPLLDRACRWNRAVGWYAREWFLGHGPCVSSSVGAGGVPACSVSGGHAVY